MSTQYHVYSGDHADGPIDYATPIGTTASLTFAPSALPPNSITRFGLRAYDTVTGYEETNLDAYLRIIIDGSGADVSGRPNAPAGLSAVPIAAGGVTIRWTYNPGGQGGAPTSFKVWATQGGAVNTGVAPNATVSYQSGVYSYSVDIASLVDGAVYTVCVRATNASGDEVNTVTVQFTADATGPAAPDNLTATVTSQA